MSYTLDHVFAECMSDKLHSKTTQRDNVLRDYDFYKDCWDSMNKWIESRLRKNKGATVGNFGTFNWDFREIDGEKQCRPIFLISDSFVKDHNVQQPKTRAVPNLAKSEEINYSKLAIKFSKTLTKDMIFSGLRDILHKIGDYVDRSYEFEIEFAFGLLLSKERRVRFDFNFLRLTQILPENMVGEARSLQLGLPLSSRLSSRGSSAGTPRNNAMARPGTSSAQFPRRTPGIAGAKLPKMQAPSGSGAEEKPAMDLSLSLDALQPPEERAEPSMQRSVTESTLSNTQPNEMVDFKSLNIDLGFGDKAASSSRPISPGLQKVLQSMDPPSPLLSKKERHSLACQAVSDQAFRRCLFNVQEEQRDDEYKETVFARLEKEQQVKDQENRQKHLEKVSDLQSTLNKQMDQKKKIKLKPQTPSATSLILDPTPAMEKEREDQKHDLLNLLNKQIESRREEKEQEKYKKQFEESRFLEHVAAEFDVQNTVERVHHLEKQRALLEDWERAAHIRNLKKLKGTDTVHKYVTTNFSGHSGNMDNTYAPETSSRGSSRGFGMSVGYDSRR